MPQTTFSKMLKQWRGKSLQKVAAGVLGISLDLYRHYEAGRKPDRLYEAHIRAKMLDPELKRRLNL